jgi:acetyl esterase/lipase
MRIIRPVLIFLVACTSGKTLFAQKKDETSFLKISNVRYATHTKADPKLNMLNVYMPKKGSNSPMVVWVHGGSWNFGDKDNVLYKAEYFTARGYVFVSINYRLSPDVKHPVHAQDVADALVWLHENATHYSADPEKIFMIGHSAGAHLAALVSIDEKYLEKSGGGLSILDGVVLLDGTGYDITQLMKHAGSKMKEWYTGSFGQTKKDWDQASPVNFVKPENNIPPFMIAYADDQEPSKKQAILLSKKLSEASIKNKVFHYEKKNASTISKELGKETDKPTEDVYRFLQEIHYTAANPIK